MHSYECVTVILGMCNCNLTDIFSLFYLLILLYFSLPYLRSIYISIPIYAPCILGIAECSAMFDRHIDYLYVK